MSDVAINTRKIPELIEQSSKVARRRRSYRKNEDHGRVRHGYNTSATIVIFINGERADSRERRRKTRHKFRSPAGDDVECLIENKIHSTHFIQFIQQEIKNTIWLYIRIFCAFPFLLRDYLILNKLIRNSTLKTHIERYLYKKS